MTVTINLWYVVPALMLLATAFVAGWLCEWGRN